MKLNIDDIEITEKIQDFKQYLETTDRIILSARFGDGKTYFLDKIRNDEVLKNKYEFFTIYPVNYSVATNENIFEYIKRDIIIQLKKKDVLYDIDYKALYDTIKNFFDFREVISFVLSLDPRLEICKRVFENIYSNLTKGKKEYEERKLTIEKYLGTFNNKGSIYEEDGYTILIKEGLARIKNERIRYKAKESVLIIEDLDRLDPGHLFRILNVLSAHIDDTSNPDLVKNKFGFHNIVIVMDYEATKHIFHHFYGENANFEGYINKFLSREPIRYSIKDVMLDKIKNVLSYQLGVHFLFPTFLNFNVKLNSFSLRDLMKLSVFDTTLKTIKGPGININGIQLSSELPLFHFISYMIEAGMNVNEIAKDFVLDPNISDERLLNEYLSLLYPMYLINKSVNVSISSFNFKNKKFKVNITYNEEDYIREIVINSQSVGLSNNKFTILNEKTIKNIIVDNFSEIINMSALSIQ